MVPNVKSYNEQFLCIPPSMFRVWRLLVYSCGSYGVEIFFSFEKKIAFNPFYKHMFKIALEVGVGNCGFIFVLKP